MKASIAGTVLLAAALAAARGAEPMPCPRQWDGLDPFRAPLATTDFYGSGDANRDGAIDAADLALVDAIAAGLRPATIRADVDGDGRISADDAVIVEYAVASGAPRDVLPGWWDHLGSEGERILWLTRMLALDPTSEFEYSTVWRQCGGYANETFLRFASYAEPLWDTDYGWGQSLFNLPVYAVSISAPGLGHSINAVLLGDDPLSFDDWFFIEPQNDERLTGGVGNIPWGATVRIFVPRHVGRGGSSTEERVAFEIGMLGARLISYHPDLVLERGAPAAGQPDNTVSVWNPRLLPSAGGRLLAEHREDGLALRAGVHFYDDWPPEPARAAPLDVGSGCTRLLDARVAPDGRAHLLLRTLADSVPAVAYALFDPGSRAVVDSAVIAAERAALCGRLAGAPKTGLHAFWLEGSHLAAQPFPPGIYWSSEQGGRWADPERIVPMDGPGRIYEWGLGGVREARDHLFDAVVDGQGRLILAWVERADADAPASIMTRAFDGAWNAPTLLEATGAHTCGLDLMRDAAGTVHLAYWTGKRQENNDWLIDAQGYPEWLRERNEEGRGILRHRRLQAGAWSEPAVVDPAGQAISPRWAEPHGAEPVLVWEKGTDAASHIAWSRLVDGAWTEPQPILPRAAPAARHPTAAIVNGGMLAMAWSEVLPSGAGLVEVCRIPFDQGLGPELSIAARAGGAAEVSWQSRSGREYRVEFCESSLWGWQPLGDELTGDGSILTVTDPAAAGCPARFYRVIEIEARGALR